MSIDLQIANKQKEIEDLRKKKAEEDSYRPLLEVGNCFKSKPNRVSSAKSYYKILYADDSGYGYRLVIYEHLSLESLRLFKKEPKEDWSKEDINIPEQQAYVSVAQWYNAESSMQYYDPITLEEYAEAKKKVFELLTNPIVPPDYETAKKNLQAAFGPKRNVVINSREPEPA